MTDFKNLYNNEWLSDVVLVFSGRRVPVHKAILSAQNKYFSKLFDGSFAEASAPEVELHDDDPDALERLLKCLYGHDVDVFGEYYAESLMRADPDEVEPKEGWSDVAGKNFLKSELRRWNVAWELSPRCRDALAGTIDLYIVADKYLAADVCDAQVRRFDFSLLHWLFYSTYFSKAGEPVDVGELVDIFGPLYEQTAGPDDAMRRALAAFFEGWWVTNVGPVPERLRVLYDALPDLHSDVLQLQASRAVGKEEN